MKTIIYILTLISLTNLAYGITFFYGERDSDGKYLGKVEIIQESEGTISFNICKSSNSCSSKKVKIDGMEERINYFLNVMERVYSPDLLNNEGDVEYVRSLYTDTMKQLRIVSTEEVYSNYKKKGELTFEVLEDQYKLRVETDKGTFQSFHSGIINSGIDSNFLITVATEHADEFSNYPLNDSMVFGFILFSNAID